MNEAFEVLTISTHTSRSLQAIDVVLHVSSDNAKELAAAATKFHDRVLTTNVRALDLWQKLSDLATLDPSTETFSVRLLWPSRAGYAARSDVLKFRFMDCDITAHVADFGNVGQPLQPCQDAGQHIDSIDHLFALAGTASGALIAECSHSVFTSEVTHNLNHELERRMSFPWLLEKPAFRKRLAIVEGGFNATLRRGVFEAAKALNIGLVIVDRQNHWLQDPQSEHLREDFVAVDMNNDNSLSRRIADALRHLSRSLDGITTFTDRYLEPTAKVALALRLATEAPEAFRRSVDKSQTQEKLSGTAALVADIHRIPQVPEHISYPLITKQVQSSGSVGVHVVKSSAELLATSQAMLKAGRRPPLIEPYEIGPEVDVNLVLLDGRLLFYEINDDFPKSAEVDYYTHPASFVETLNAYPSKLEQSEQGLLKETLFKQVIDLGFRNGVFHVEARVRDSSSSYKKSPDGTLDLSPNLQDNSSASPSVRLIEANARAPGYQCNRAAAHAYGVSYYALCLLLALRDYKRVQKLEYAFYGSDSVLACSNFFASNERREIRW